MPETIFSAKAYTVVSQYGTHVDVPCHMVENTRSLESVGLDEMVLPLCVIDKSSEVGENPDFVLKVEDILQWEEENGKIPAKSFVAFRSDWSKRPAAEMDNNDEEGNRHFPGWSFEAVEFLVDERNVSAIGHETSDTDSPLTSGKTNYEVERLILEKDRIQIEMLKDLDQCPAVGGIIFCTFPRIKGGPGFTARCFAICPK